MKRYLMGALALTVILALLPLSDAMAQLKWEGGVKGGISMANFYGDDVENTSIKIGAAGGAFVTAHITEMFGVRLEGLYMQKGAKGEYEDTTGTTVEEKAKFDYIEIPLLGVASFEAGEKMMINVFAGPALGILVSAKWEDEDVKDFTKSMDFGVTGGAGFTYAMEAFTILLEGRFTLGLMNTDDSEDACDCKNMNFAVMGGFSIPFGGTE
jgi:hypothetical protein